MIALPGLSLVFWDFDGVIKESVDIKTAAYVALFRPYGEALAERVRTHHLEHGGVSRYEKVPLYLSWAGEPAGPEQVAAVCEDFDSITTRAVIESPWVPGVEALLRAHRGAPPFVVVSATPGPALRTTIATLGLEEAFAAIYGSPTGKADAIRRELEARGLGPEACLMIGDGRADLEAAEATGVPFLLRRHPLNEAVFAAWTGPAITDFEGPWTA